MTTTPPSPAETNLHALRINPADRQPRGRRTIWWIVLTLVLALLIGGSSLWLYQMTLGQPPTVQIAIVRRMSAGTPMNSTVLSSAGYVVTGNRYISIGVRVAGRIDAYEVQEGDFVRKGSILVRLDDRDYQAALQKAQANLALAKANLALRRKQSERMRQLHERGLISIEALDVADNEHAVAQATVQQAEAEVRLTHVNLDYTKLTAPTDGIVLAKLKEVGEIAVPGGFAGAGDLIRIANLDDLRGEVDINEVDFHHVHMDQPVEVAPDAYPDRKYAARVVKIYPQANRQKGTLKVEVKFAKADTYLRPDMSVRINFLLDETPTDGAAPQVLAPKSGLRREEEQAFVWIVQNERIVRIPVHAGKELGDMVQIISGLEGGEAVVLSGPEALREGVRVRTTEQSSSH
ncbi:MAG: efflux RND transporter periplasmic adaptor subunit [Deltaproteobacteria bacterium]|nr:efflux RND transporter periplasmic adaptor subunit [Deltaproteobacteria bacterium]